MNKDQAWARKALLDNSMLDLRPSYINGMGSPGDVADHVLEGLVDAIANYPELLQVLGRLAHARRQEIKSDLGLDLDLELT